MYLILAFLFLLAAGLVAVFILPKLVKRGMRDIGTSFFGEFDVEKFASGVGWVILSLAVLGVDVLALFVPGLLLLIRSLF